MLAAQVLPPFDRSLVQIVATLAQPASRYSSAISISTCLDTNSVAAGVVAYVDSCELVCRQGPLISVVIPVAVVAVNRSTTEHIADASNIGCGQSPKN
jgi:hypothetical protein